MATIMVVDDENIVRRMVTRVLEHHGYAVLGARCGARGIECFDQHADEIELVLTDVVMPKMSGPEMVKLILKRKSSVKVVFMTGYGPPDGLPNPSNQFGLLFKPFSIEALTRKVRESLEENSN